MQDFIFMGLYVLDGPWRLYIPPRRERVMLHLYANIFTLPFRISKKFCSFLLLLVFWFAPALRYIVTAGSAQIWNKRYIVGDGAFDVPFKFSQIFKRAIRESPLQSYN